MNHTITAKKETGLGDLLKEYVPQQLEEKKEVIIAAEHPLHSLLSIYHELLQYDIRDVFPSYGAEVNDLNKVTLLFEEKIKSYILKPEEINLFLQASLLYEIEPWQGCLRGIFVSALIQNSYNAGCNNFTVQWNEKMPLSNLGVLIEGKKGNPIILKAAGNIGQRLGTGANYVDIYAQNGKEMYFVGGRIKNSLITIVGNAADVGFFAQDSVFDIRGNIENSRGMIERSSSLPLHGAKGCTIKIAKNIYQSPSPHYPVDMSKCIFKTGNQQALEWLMRNIPCNNYSHNKIYFIEEEGTERLEKA